MVAAVLFLCPAAGETQEPVAIVEAVSIGAPVALFTYLLQGQLISLDADAEVQIGYLHSCVQEHVRGGVITIGRERSHVAGGQRTETILDCRDALADLTQSEIEHGAAIVIRESVSIKPQMVIASTSPFIAAKKPAVSIHLKRLDRDESTRTLTLHNGAADLAALGITLHRGGIYRIEAGSASVIVEIAADARSGSEPILLRLLSF